MSVNAIDVTQQMRPRIRARWDEIRAALDRLGRIPSVSNSAFDPEPVRESARQTAEVFRSAGVETRLLEREGAHPAVLGRMSGPAGAPTVLLYAHHDVQPPGPADRWSSDPFIPTERNGRLYGRGIADDKAGIVAHLAALLAYDGKLPVNIALLIEGEEESGSLHLREFLDAEKDALRCSAVVIADSTNWRLGQPAIVTSMRGIVRITVEVRVSDHAVHSGGYGGTIPDALMALSRLIASLHDDNGTVAVEGLLSEDADGLDLTPTELRGYVGARPSLQLIGRGTLTSRMWRQPAISIIGVDATPVRQASNTIWPVAAARISMRVAPGQKANAAQAALIEHLRANVPWGAELNIKPGPTGEPFTAATKGVAYDAMRAALGGAWARPAVAIGQGGSIPFLSDFAEVFPQASLLITGVKDPASNAHAENESLHLGEFENVCVAEATFLALLGAGADDAV